MKKMVGKPLLLIGTKKSFNISKSERWMETLSNLAHYIV